MPPVIQIRPENWNELHAVFQKLEMGYLFRGQSDAKWELATSLERCLADLLKSEQIFPAWPENKEHWMLHEFKSKSHLYSAHLPPENDNVEWLTVMQHHGCPTRLLDFTYSPYVAAYFAVIDATGDAAIWALDWWTMRNNLRGRFLLEYEERTILKDEINRRHLKLANQFVAHLTFEPEPELSLIPLEPKKQTDRISRQQGIFVMPTNARKSFEENLCAAYNLTSKAWTEMSATTVQEVLAADYLMNDLNRPCVIKIVLSIELQKRAIGDLTKMNISAESLFGGLDGLARSLVQTVIRK